MDHGTLETFPTLSNEVYHDEVQQDVRKDEVCECPLGADARKLTLVLGIDLKRKRRNYNNGLGSADGSQISTLSFPSSLCELSARRADIKINYQFVVFYMYM